MHVAYVLGRSVLVHICECAYVLEHAYVHTVEELCPHACVHERECVSR